MMTSVMVMLFDMRFSLMSDSVGLGSTMPPRTRRSSLRRPENQSVWFRSDATLVWAKLYIGPQDASATSNSLLNPESLDVPGGRIHEDC